MENRTKTIQLRVEPSVKEMAQILSKKDGRSISSYLIELVRGEWDKTNMKFYTVKDISKTNLPPGTYQEVISLGAKEGERSYMRISEKEMDEKCIRTGEDLMCDECTFDGKNEDSCKIFFTVRG